MPSCFKCSQFKQKMKIGVMTFWHGNSNYGQIMQCWAMQQYLKRQGHEPYIIRFVPSNYSSSLKRFLKKVLLIEHIRKAKEFLFKQDAFLIKRRNEMNDSKRQFDDFRQKHLDFSDHLYYDIIQIRKNPPVADAYIVGSDQVWAQMLDNINSRAFYLDFGKPETKRIAYAPSFVVKEYPAAYRKDLNSLLKRFDAVSTREYSGVDICKSVGIEAIKVLDPTLLLDRNDYLSLIVEPVEKKKQIFIYSLNISSSEQIRWEELKKYAIDNDKKVVVTPSQGYFAADELFGDDVEYLYATPQQWLRTIAESELVVTPSFHGVALSIIMGIPFIYVPLKGAYESGNARVDDLLKDLQLSPRILSDGVQYNTLAEQAINWNTVSLALTRYRSSSYEFLKNCGI